MKKNKFLLYFLAVLFNTANLITPNITYAADQWTKGDPQGTEASGTIDNILRINNEATDRLLINYKRGLGVNYVSANALSVLQGEIAIPNAAGSIIKWRRTTAATALGWGDIDTGSEEVSKTYYVYTTADTDVTGMVFKISLSSSAPSGSTYYRKLASFYNNASGSIENVISLRSDDGTDYKDDVKGSINFTGTGTVAINSSYNVSSITDNGTGDYTITWTTPFSTAYYSIATGVARALGAAATTGATVSAQTTTSTRILTTNSVDAAVDCERVFVIATGDR